MPELKSYKCISVNGKSVRIHRIIVEIYLGRKLKSNEIVHHIDGDIFNNNIANLEITNRSEHAKIHYKPRNKNGTIKTCCKCGKCKYLPPSVSLRTKKQGEYKCVDCYKKYKIWRIKNPLV